MTTATTTTTTTNTKTALVLLATSVAIARAGGSGEDQVATASHEKDLAAQSLAAAALADSTTTVADAMAAATLTQLAMPPINTPDSAVGPFVLPPPPSQASSSSSESSDGSQEVLQPIAIQPLQMQTEQSASSVIAPQPESTASVTQHPPPQQASQQSTLIISIFCALALTLVFLVALALFCCRKRMAKRVVARRTIIGRAEDDKEEGGVGTPVLEEEEEGGESQRARQMMHIDDGHVFASFQNPAAPALSSDQHSGVTEVREHDESGLKPATLERSGIIDFKEIQAVIQMQNNMTPEQIARLQQLPRSAIVDGVAVRAGGVERHQPQQVSVPARAATMTARPGPAAPSVLSQPTRRGSFSLRGSVGGGGGIVQDQRPAGSSSSIDSRCSGSEVDSTPRKKRQFSAAAGGVEVIGCRPSGEVVYGKLWEGFGSDILSVDEAALASLGVSPADSSPFSNASIASAQPSSVGSQRHQQNSNNIQRKIPTSPLAGRDKASHSMISSPLAASLTRCTGEDCESSD